MLERIRRNRKLILWTLLALIVPPFIFFGIESAFIKKQDSTVGILFGRKILLSDFYKARTVTLAMLNLRQPGRPVDPTLLDQLAWQRLILLDQINRLDFQVSDSELSEAIIKNFSQDDFDPKSYEFFVKQVLKLSIFEFENAYRETLLIEKFQDTVSKLIQVTDEEVYEGYLYEKEKLEIRYCEIPFHHFLASVHVTEKELEKYFSENQESFRVGVQRKIGYFTIPLKNFEKPDQITQKKVEDYYRSHRNDFKEPLSKIYAEVEGKLKTQKTKALAHEAAKKIYRAISKGASLKKVSQKFGLKIEYSPFFPEENPLPLWKDDFTVIRKIFTGEIKEPLDPFLHNLVFYIIVPLREKPSYLPKLDEVKSKVQDILIEQKARDKAMNHAEKLWPEVARLIQEKHLSFAKACRNFGKKSIKTPPFSRWESRVPNDPLGEIKRAAWNQPMSKISEVYATGKGSGFFIILRTFKPSLEEFEKEKIFFQEKVLNRKRQKVFFEYYDWLLRQCQFFRINPKDF